MQTHEKFLAALLVVATLAVVSAPRWWPDAPPAVAKKSAPRTDPDQAPAATRPPPLPPFDASEFPLQAQTPHFAIASNASPAQTARVGEVLEALHAAYAQFFADRLPARPAGARFQVALYRDRADFQRHNTSRAWAEGYYRKPVCHAYYDAGRPNPVHWMLHEATHQLDTEWAGFPRTPWVEEGLASYFGTSRIESGVLAPGDYDPDTYPLWWLDAQYLSGDLEADLAARRVIPLRELIDSDGPPRPADVNRYYVGYWSLTHYLLHGDGGRHAAAYRQLVAEGGSLANFERLVGPVERMQAGWYAYLFARHQELLALRGRGDGRRP
jgi:hypothetical protein